jgi:hypothetical protein
VQETPLRDEALLTPAALVALAESPLLAQIEELHLLGNWLGEEGLRALAASPHVVGLKSLNLLQGASPAGLRAVVESPRLATLARLDLSWTKLDSSLAALLAEPHVLPALIQLAVGPVAPEDRARLARRFGDGLTVDEQE